MNKEKLNNLVNDSGYLLNTLKHILDEDMRIRVFHLWEETIKEMSRLLSQYQNEINEMEDYE